MSRGDWQLLFAGLAGALAAFFSGAAVTIAVISSARPPVWEGLDAATNAKLAAQAQWAWVAPLMGFILALLVLGQVVVRRPLLAKEEWARRWPRDSAVHTWGVAVFAVGTLVYVTLDILRSLEQIPVGEALTDSSWFARLKTPLGMGTLVLSVVSMNVMMRWWGRNLDGRVDS